MNFIDSLDGQQSPPPFFFRGMVIRTFLLSADQVKLQDYCDKFLNITPTKYFQVLAPLVYLSINSYPKMVLEGREDLGFTRQDEFFLMLPVLRYAALGTVLLPCELTWVFPFIGVNNPTSAIAGQTALGFPKLLGQISAQTSANGAFAGEVVMPGFATLSKNSRQEDLLIIDVKTGAALAPAPAICFPWELFKCPGVLDEMTEAVLDMLNLIGDLPNFCVTTLKQIRCATQPVLADIQKLLRGEWQLSNMGAPVTWDAAKVAIQIYDNSTTRIVATLGLAGAPQPNGSLKTTVLSAYSMTVDMRFADFTVLD